MPEPRIIPPAEARSLREGYLSLTAAERRNYQPLREALHNAASDLAHTAAVLGEQREAVLALHHKVEWHLMEAPADFDGDYWDPLDHPLEPFCHECTDDEDTSAIDAGDLIDVDALVVPYPCPTALALGVTS